MKCALLQVSFYDLKLIPLYKSQMISQEECKFLYAENLK